MLSSIPGWLGDTLRFIISNPSCAHLPRASLFSFATAMSGTIFCSLSPIFIRAKHVGSARGAAAKKNRLLFFFIRGHGTTEFLFSAGPSRAMGSFLISVFVPLFGSRFLQVALRLFLIQCRQHKYKRDTNKSSSFLFAASPLERPSLFANVLPLLKT